MDRIESQPAEKNEFLKSLDNESQVNECSTTHMQTKNLILKEQVPSYSAILEYKVKTWTDFNYSYFHPRSIFELTSHTCGDETNVLGLFSRGSEVFEDLHMVNSIIWHISESTWFYILAR
jgi:hypothetical protein